MVEQILIDCWPAEQLSVLERIASSRVLKDEYANAGGAGHHLRQPSVELIPYLNILDTWRIDQTASSRTQTVVITEKTSHR